MRVDYGLIPEMQLAARRHRAQAIARLLALGFAWLVTHLRPRHTPRGHTLARGW